MKSPSKVTSTSLFVKSRSNSQEENEGAEEPEAHDTEQECGAQAQERGGSQTDSTLERGLDGSRSEEKLNRMTSN